VDERPIIECQLSALPDDLVYIDSEYPANLDKTYFRKERYEESFEENKIQKTESSRLMRRSVIHPHFKNFDAKEAESFLDKKEVGEFIIRPSASSTDQLTITIKFYEGLFVHIPIKETNKENVWSLGKKLIIGTPPNEDTFEDLNDVIVNYITPIISYAEEMHQHEKFKHGRKEELNRFLHSKKMKIPRL